MKPDGAIPDGVGRFVGKIPGGKLLKLDAEIRGGRVASLRIRGDFFAHPEEAFDRVEASLEGVAAADFARELSLAVEREGVVIFGIGVGDLADAFERAVDGIQAS